jgi:hypothetical protein
MTDGSWRPDLAGGYDEGMNLPPTTKPFTSRHTATALVATVILLVLQLAATIALYGWRATANNSNPRSLLCWTDLLDNDLFVLWLPPAATVLAIGMVLSICLPLKNLLAYFFVAAALSAVTWITALTIAINRWGA